MRKILCWLFGHVLVSYAFGSDPPEQRWCCYVCHKDEIWQEDWSLFGNTFIQHLYISMWEYIKEKNTIKFNKEELPF